MAKEAPDSGHGSRTPKRTRLPAGDAVRRHEIVTYARQLTGSIGKRRAALEAAQERGDVSPGPLPSIASLYRWLKADGIGRTRSNGSAKQNVAIRSGASHDRLAAAEKKLNHLAARLSRVGGFDDHVIEHRRLLKAIKRARSSHSPDRIRRVLSVIRNRCSEYSEILNSKHDLPATRERRDPSTDVTRSNADGSPHARRARRITKSQTGAVPEYGQNVGWDRLPKPERDARIRAILLLPYLNGAMTSEECAANWRALINGDEPEDKMLLLLGLPDTGVEPYRSLTGRSIRRWAKKVQDAHAEAMAENRPPPPVHEVLRHNKPQSARRKKCTPEVEQLIKHLFLDNPGYKAANVADVLKHLHGIDLHKRTVQRVVATIPDWERALNRGGPAAAEVMLRAKLLREAPYPNHTWLMDHSFLKQEAGVVAEQPGKDFDFELSALIRTWNAQGQPANSRTDRIHLTVVQDACTRFPVAVRLWPKTPTTRETLVVLWEAAVRYGLPERLYTDNGSDFASGDVATALQEAGIYHVFSRPYTPEGRGKVERLFRTIKQRVMVHMPGYCGGRHATVWADEELLAFEELERRVLGGIDLLLNAEVHGSTGRKPREHFEEEVGARGIPPDPARLMCLLMTKDEVTKHGHGVRFRNRRYHTPELVSVVNGTCLRVHFDPYRSNAIHLSVRDANGAFRYIGRAEAYHGGDGTPDQRSVRAAETAWIEEQQELNERHKAVVQQARRRAVERDRASDHVEELAARLAEDPVGLLPAPQQSRQRLRTPTASNAERADESARPAERGGVVINPLWD